MMRSSLLLLALLPLAACAGRPAPAEDAPPTPAHAACRTESRNDPAVLALRQQANPGSFANQTRIEYDTRVAELRAYRDCLRRNGLAAPGGVEAPRL
ncbi:phosphoribosylamine--glycine ligase [Roseomonas sp. GC11]|uniref:phosphoribosylamine--glycine ligase n=1 Tax=Roseomonas sp. GC11 TaxID=2950546 RepID=UPI00210BD27A|nr:phosphoribosylamine--glycine ligase [Roseomonas sp. GC11]MCQ4162141.1 phosphoribosylamine--glycine ligase [Roseomonas sp. GC11]